MNNIYNSYEDMNIEDRVNAIIEYFEHCKLSCDFKDFYTNNDCINLKAPSQYRMLNSIVNENDGETLFLVWKKNKEFEQCLTRENGIRLYDEVIKRDVPELQKNDTKRKVMKI